MKDRDGSVPARRPSVQETIMKHNTSTFTTSQGAADGFFFTLIFTVPLLTFVGGLLGNESGKQCFVCGQLTELKNRCFKNEWATGTI